MKSKKIIVFFSLLLILSLVVFTSCTPAKAATTTPSSATIFDRIAAVEARITSVETTANTAVSTATSAKDIASIAEKTANNVQVNASTTTLKTQLSQLENKVDAIQSIDPSVINTIKADIKALKEAKPATTVDTSAIETKISTIESKLTSLESKINALDNKVNDLAKTIPTPTNPADPTTEPVFVTLQGNAFTGQTILNYASIPTAGASQSLSFILSNNTGKTLTNISLAVGFVFINPTTSSVTTKPANISAVLTTSGLAPVWTLTTATDNTMLVFVTQSGSGILGSLYSFTQAAKSQTYSLTLTLSSTTTDIATAYNLYPIVKVLSYN